jgi:hypothetical protein
MQLFGYMALILISGFVLISFIKDDLPLHILRKVFHLWAFLMFLPGLGYSKYDKPRLMVFAFNCVTVALIFLELLRFGGFLPSGVTKLFKSLSDGREKAEATMITTHIYLLMGCALPF